MGVTPLLKMWYISTSTGYSNQRSLLSEKLYKADRTVDQDASGDTPQTDEPTRSKYRCPTCDRPITGKPEDFPICTLAQHFQTVRDKLEQAAKNKGIPYIIVVQILWTDKIHCYWLIATSLP